MSFNSDSVKNHYSVSPIYSMAFNSDSDKNNYSISPIFVGKYLKIVALTKSLKKYEMLKFINFKRK